MLCLTKGCKAYRRMSSQILVDLNALDSTHFHDQQGISFRTLTEQ